MRWLMGAMPDIGEKGRKQALTSPILLLLQTSCNHVIGNHVFKKQRFLKIRDDSCLLQQRTDTPRTGKAGFNKCRALRAFMVLRLLRVGVFICWLQ